MNVYVLIQKWKDEYNNEAGVIGVYTNLSEAKEKLKKLYAEDIAWAKENTNDLINTWIHDKSSYVSFDNGAMYCSNTIETKTLINEPEDYEIYIKSNL